MLEASNLANTQLGKYQIEGLVGEGGMAYVYKAFHVDFEVPVAIKVLFPEQVRSEDIRARFQREGRIQFKLRHPNIVRVLDLIDEQGIVGMAMDWVQGMDMDEYLDMNPGPRPLSEIRRLLVPISEAIGHAHEHNIIHRDLKPANILLEGQPGREVPKVMDFGIAKSLEDDGVKTKTNAILGTPYYLAPEVAFKGQEGQIIDHRIDIYALGITLFRMLTGELPYDGENVLAIVMAHYMNPIPNIREWLPDCDPRIEELIAKSMSKSPLERYGTCAEFIDALIDVCDSGHVGRTVVPDASARPGPAQPNPAALLPTASFDGENVSSTPQGSNTGGKKSSTSMLLIGVVLALVAVIGALLFTGRNRGGEVAAPPGRVDFSNGTKARIKSRTRRKLVPRPVKRVRPAVIKRVEPKRRIPKTVRRAAVVRKNLRCKPRGNFRSCRRCIKRRINTLMLRNSRNLMPGLKPSYRCNIRDYRSLGRYCASRCGCKFENFCAAYLKQRFDATGRGRVPAGKQGVCRGFTQYSRVLERFSRYYSNANAKTAKTCRKTWRSFRGK